MNDIERLQCQLYALTEIAKTLTLPLELPGLFNATIKKIVGVTEPDEVRAVMLGGQLAGLFHPVATFGYESQASQRVRTKSNGSYYRQGIRWRV